MGFYSGHDGVGAAAAELAGGLRGWGKVVSMDRMMRGGEDFCGEDWGNGGRRGLTVVHAWTWNLPTGSRLYMV